MESLEAAHIADSEVLCDPDLADNTQSQPEDGYSADEYPLKLSNDMYELYTSSWEPEYLDRAVQAARDVLASANGEPLHSAALDQLGLLLNVRYDHVGESNDNEEAVSVHRRVIGLMPQRHPFRPYWLGNLANALQSRFERLGEDTDLEAAIATHREAVRLTPQNHENMPSRLNNLGISLESRFDRFGELQDLEAAIMAKRQAVDITHESHPEKPKWMHNYAIALQTRFEEKDTLEDLEVAIAIHDHADNLIAEDNPDKTSYLDSLGSALLCRFERLGDLKDLEAAISRLRRAVDLISDEHVNKPVRLGNLGLALLSRFDRTGSLEDLASASLVLQRAVELTPEDHAGRSSRLNNLGTCLYKRSERVGDLQDLETAVSLKRQAVSLTPDDHPDKPTRLTKFGNALASRYEHLGDIDDLEAAILVQRRAIDFSPNDDLDEAFLLSNLANTLQSRFGGIGEAKDLEEAIVMHHRAIGLTSEDHPDKPSRLNNLGQALQSRFESTGDPADLESAILMSRRAVEITPNDHPAKAARLNALGVVLRTRCDRFGQLEDVEEAISAQGRSVDLTPDGHPDMPIWLHNLAMSLESRFDRIGELDDLETAISMQHRAVALIPEGHYDEPLLLNNLGNYLQSRFRRNGELADIETAISAHRRAVNLTQEGHPDKALWLNNFGNALQEYFERTGDTSELLAAVSVKRQAVDLTVEGHPHKPFRLNNLGNTLRSQFEHTGDIGHLNNAILVQHRAIDSMPEDHPEKPTLLYDIGQSLVRRFEHDHTQHDFDTVVRLLKEATLKTLGVPSVRLKAAMQCVHMLSAYPEFGTTETLLSAHSRVLDVLPEITWLGHSISRRYEESSKLGNLVTSAVATAIRFSKTSLAVEWLEAGRSFVWSQILSLRTPLEELEEAQPELAQSLRKIQQQLQQSVHVSSIPKRTANQALRHEEHGGTVNAAADKHRQLVLQYERVLAEIRDCMGFEDFVRPRTLQSLISSIGTLPGPVIFLNVNHSRCDALCLLPSREIKLVELPALTEQRASKLRSLWQGCLSACGLHERAVALKGVGLNLDVLGSSRSFGHILERLWTWVVSPILRALDLHSVPNVDQPLPHVTWCPTGPLTQLPIHAAGVYNFVDGPHIFDFVVSSYTPSLSALARSWVNDAEKQSTPNVLTVTQSATPGFPPLPGTIDERVRLLNVLSEYQIGSTYLDDEHATVDAVRALISQASWVHFACHGSQDPDDPIQSAFRLHDGPLTLASLMRTVADDAELAFLSACQTAVGNENIPEESVHLAAGMLVVGYKGVIATMWSIRDADAPVVVEAYYKKLLALRQAGTLPMESTGAARALHDAVKVLREQVGMGKFERWVPFVHFGG